MVKLDVVERRTDADGDGQKETLLGQIANSDKYDFKFPPPSFYVYRNSFRSQ